MGRRRPAAASNRPRRYRMFEPVEVILKQRIKTTARFLKSAVQKDVVSRADEIRYKGV